MDGGIAVELSLQTRSMSSTSYTYEVGSEWENYIDISGGDYRLYFFTYDPSNTSNADTNNRLISEFNPYDVMAVEGSVYTRYTLTGIVEDAITEYSNFKVVILANWGEAHYPTTASLVTIADDPDNATTINDLCTAQTAVFDAFVQGGTATMPSSTLHIPFYGVREYSGVTWKSGWRTVLEGDITLLRSVAKVEVILEPTEYQPDISFSNVSINNYNAQGYCAPTGVYLRGDYDHNYAWADDFVDGLHLVNTDANGNGINDDNAQGKSFSFHKTQDKIIDETTGNVTQYETWVAYVPEYDNMGSDFSYFSVMTDFQLDSDEPYKIYFANYTDGGTTAYGDNEGDDKSDRYNIYRNHLYRYRITPGEYGLLVSVYDWEAAFDNEWTFGDMDIGKVLDNGERFLIDNYWEYIVIDSDNLEVAMTYNTSEEGNVTNYSGEIEIPETVYYNGVYYTVTAIDEECFYGGTGITSVTIPGTVSEIGDEAFSGCTGLETITCLTITPPDCGDNAFSGVSTESCTLYVLEESLSDYQSTSPWSGFTNVEVVSDGQEP